MQVTCAVLAFFTAVSQVSGQTWDVNSPRCEICDNTETEINYYSLITRSLIVNDFSSESGVWEFYVRIKLEHSYLDEYEISITQDGSERTQIWDGQCEGLDDFSALFFDSATSDSDDPCEEDRNGNLLVEPSELFSDTGLNRSADGAYLLELGDLSLDEKGRLYQVCVGFFDQVSCEFDGSTLTTRSVTRNSPRCEVCDSEVASFGPGGSVTKWLDFSEIEWTDEPGETVFFVSMKVKFDVLGSLNMNVSVEDDGSSVTIWNNECGTNSDLNVVFSDILLQTVEDQGGCDADLDTVVYALSGQLFSENGVGGYGDRGKRYQFELTETMESGEGSVNELCMGWFTENEGACETGENGSKQGGIGLIGIVSLIIIHFGFVF